MCRFEITESNKIRYELAKQYHDETEAYDRVICTGPIRFGHITPATDRQMRLSAKNAHEVRNRIMVAAEGFGINRRDMQRAIANYPNP